MSQAILSNARCWVEHMQLNQSTGLDPDGVMLRASECAAQFALNTGFRAAAESAVMRTTSESAKILVGSCGHGSSS